MAMFKVSLLFFVIAARSAALPLAYDESSAVDSIAGEESSVGSNSKGAVESGARGSFPSPSTEAKAAPEIARKRAEYDSDGGDNLREPLSPVQSAVMHLVKANADEKLKILAEKQENTEIKAAQKDEAISEKIRKNSAASFATAEKEADDIDRLVAKLNRIAAEHEARARAAMARAAALEPSSEDLSQLDELLSQLDAGASDPIADTNCILDE